ncbi:MAG: TlpA disulfide reductase family protein [Planctomycetota bacterium]
MFKSLLTAAACAAMLAPAAVAQDVIQAPSLAVGDKAPQLDSVEWIKGKPVSAFAEGEIYVLDFWATWCGPCIASIPHINELQAKHKDDKVNVIGVAIWPSPNMTPTDEFVEAQGDRMNYRIATDIDNRTSDAYMRASGQGGIPTVMVVDKQGDIAWIGHPMAGLDTALDLLVADEFTVERMEAEMQKLRAEEEARQAKIAPVMQRVQQALTPGSEDWAAAETALAELIEIDSQYVQGAAPYLYVSKAKQGKRDDARKYVADLMSTVFKDDAMSLNAMAWTMVGPDSPLMGDELDTELAITIAKKAVELSNEKDADIMDTLARAYYMDESYPLAVEIQTRVVEMAPGNAMYQESLEEYKKAAAKG